MTELDWNNLRVVLAVARAGSLTKAANLLHLDQTTAGRKLTALEGQLSTTLFVRSKAGFIPTDDGRAVIEHAAGVEEQIDQLKETIATPQLGASGVVRLMGNTWMLERIAMHLPNLLKTHPAIELRFSGRLPPTPIHGEATISFWFDAMERPTEASHAFARIPYAAYTSATTQVPRHHWVQFRDDDATGPSFSREMRRRLGAEAEVRMTATDARILMAAVSAGVGQGVLPKCLGNHASGLVPSEVRLGQINRLLRCHANPGAARTVRTRAVLDWLIRILPQAADAEILPGAHEVVA